MERELLVFPIRQLVVVKPLEGAVPRLNVGSLVLVVPEMVPVRETEMFDTTEVRWSWADSDWN
ncbi:MULTISPECIES: hypothetical protein [unclassified Paenibacillus]|uniref:hypothetical protein n=1 Tax=unclassified Paenibacillus TaxID=185978 RepID=UPI001B47F150|nr:MULTISPECIES: hypothetical protein [unclassified Paenibacillus]MBP1157102.1 hypothetical protein [Paenibacillus sp. PvP091]MBP1172159.1 hypothetical protein [Paenibacillus sp. PvR098]MBP2438540.1 hypothetical protein [Paenibacillus sp. PvP052]